MSDNPVRVRLHVETNYVGCDFEIVEEIPREEWDQMDEHERDKLCTELAVEYQNEVAPCGFEVLNP